MQINPGLSTKNANTWCPSCTNFSLLASVKIAISSLIKKGIKKKDFAMVTGIGCHGKIFDYLNISGVYGLHGRTIPTAHGITLGNPNLKVLVFAGDGDSYAEGMEHFIHAFRNNPNITLIVHDNRDFSLTGGQPSPTTQKGYKSKVTPKGEEKIPFNPIKIALACGGGFIARCNAKDIKHTAKIIEKAINYNGFSFIEVIQNCQIFNTELNDIDSKMYKVNNSNIKKAYSLADEWDYNSKNKRIPIGIIYSKKII